MCSEQQCQGIPVIQYCDRAKLVIKELSNQEQQRPRYPDDWFVLQGKGTGPNAPAGLLCEVWSQSRTKPAPWFVGTAVAFPDTDSWLAAARWKTLKLSSPPRGFCDTESWSKGLNISNHTLSLSAFIRVVRTVISQEYSRGLFLSCVWGSTIIELYCPAQNQITCNQICLKRV